MEQAIERLSKMGKARRSAVIDALVEESVRALGSTIGYFAVMNDSEDVLTMLGWSKSAIASSYSSSSGRWMQAAGGSTWCCVATISAASAGR